MKKERRKEKKEKTKTWKSTWKNAKDEVLLGNCFSTVFFSSLFPLFLHQFLLLRVHIYSSSCLSRMFTYIWNFYYAFFMLLNVIFVFFLSFFFPSFSPSILWENIHVHTVPAVECARGLSMLWGISIIHVQAVVEFWSLKMFFRSFDSGPRFTINRRGIINNS